MPLFSLKQLFNQDSKENTVSWRLPRNVQSITGYVFFVLFVGASIMMYETERPSPHEATLTPSTTSGPNEHPTSHTQPSTNKKATIPPQEQQPTAHFPQNIAQLENDFFTYCNHSGRRIPYELRCTKKRLHYKLLKQSTYNTNGAFNHHFNDELLSAYMPTPASSVLIYQDTLWYQRPSFPAGSKTLLDYITTKLQQNQSLNQKHFNENWKLFSRLTKRNLLKSLASAKPKTSTGDIYNHVPKNTDVSELQRIHKALIDLYATDSVIQKLKSHYLVLRLFELNTLIEHHQVLTLVTEEGELLFPDLSSTTIRGTPNALNSADYIVFDFAQITTKPASTVPLLTNYSGNFDDKNHDLRLTLWHGLTLADMINQVNHLKKHFNLEQTASLTAPKYLTPTTAGNNFIQTYKKWYPFPPEAMNRAHERAITINHLINDSFGSALTIDTQTLINIPFGSDESQPFVRMKETLLTKLDKARRSNRFNPHQGIYQAPRDKIDAHMRELNDRKRWLQQQKLGSKQSNHH